MTTQIGYSNHKINGVPLNTLGWHMMDMSGADGIPGRRGDNQPTPYQDGEYSYGQKFYDGREFTLNMRVMGMDSDGVVSHASGRLGQLRSNIDYLKGVLNQNPGHQVLSFEVRDPITEAVTTREIGVEILATIPFNDPSTGVYEFGIVFTAARPFWKELPMTTVVETITTTDQTFYIDTAGTAPINDMVITIEADEPMGNPSLLCVSTGDLISVSDPAMILNDTYVIDLGAKTFTKNGVRADTAIRRTAAWFMRLPPSSALEMEAGTDNADAFTLTLEYYKKWL